MLAEGAGEGPVRDVTNPANPADVVGSLREATAADVAAALAAVDAGFAEWSARPAAERAGVLRAAADLYEANGVELMALATREAGKTLADAIAELREAVDFLRYYGDAAEAAADPPRGVVVCISPWNFPLAIFTGQVAACLGAGNAVIAKPAEQTPLIAARAAALLHEAGVPRAALQLRARRRAGRRAADRGCADRRDRLHRFDRDRADHPPHHRHPSTRDAVLIAETGGINAMMADRPRSPSRSCATCWPRPSRRRASAARRFGCSTCSGRSATARVRMLEGAMDELVIGDPWEASTDVGPVIDAEAEHGITGYVDGSSEMKRRRCSERVASSLPPLIAVGGID